MEILIFHYNKRQGEGIYWLLMVKGALFYVNSWECTAPIESRQLIEEMVTHPHYEEGKVALPRFYLKTRGICEIVDGKASIRAPVL